MQAAADNKSFDKELMEMFQDLSSDEQGSSDDEVIIQTDEQMNTQKFKQSNIVTDSQTDKQSHIIF